MALVLWPSILISRDSNQFFLNQWQLLNIFCQAHKLTPNNTKLLLKTPMSVLLFFLSSIPKMPITSINSFQLYHSKVKKRLKKLICSCLKRFSRTMQFLWEHANQICLRQLWQSKKHKLKTKAFWLKKESNWWTKFCQCEIKFKIKKICIDKSKK